MTRGKVAWAVCVGVFIAFLTLFALVALGVMRLEPLHFLILMISILTVWIAGMVAAITYSEGGWVVKGSKVEWIVAFLFNPLVCSYAVPLGRGLRERNATS